MTWHKATDRDMHGLWVVLADGQALMRCRGWDPERGEVEVDVSVAGEEGQEPIRVYPSTTSNVALTQRLRLSFRTAAFAPGRQLLYWTPTGWTNHLSAKVQGPKYTVL